MRRKTIITIGCFIYLLSPIFCMSIGFSIESGTSSLFQYVASQSMGPAFQPVFIVFARGAVDLNDTFSLQLAVSAHSALPSSPDAELKFFRGYAGTAWTGSLGFIPFSFFESEDFSARLGFRLEGGFTLSQYTDSQLYFVYPSAGFRTETELRFRSNGKLPVGMLLELPVRIDFRKDLTLALSTGFSVGIRLLPVRMRSTGKE